MRPLSIFLITKNEARLLGQVLEAVQSLSDDIVVLDSGSTDGTQDIAKEHGARLEHRDFDGFGAQKSHAESLCKHDWILNLDGDEIVSPATCEEIRNFLSSEDIDAIDGVRIKVVTCYPHEEQPRLWADYKNHVRLYNKTSMRFSTHPSHDVVTIEPHHQLHQLENIIHHYSFASLDALEEKKRSLTRFYFETEKHGPLWKNVIRLPIEYPYTFFKSYILRRQMTGGMYGFKLSAMQAKYRTLRIWQRIRGKCVV